MEGPPLENSKGPPQHQRSGLTLLEHVLAVGCLLWLTSAFDRVAYASLPKPVVQISIAALYAAAMLMLLRAPRHSVQAAASAWPILLVVGLAMVSVLWSANPGLTLRRSLALLETTAVGIFLAVRFRLENQLMLVAIALGVVALLSVVVALGMPEFGVMQGVHAGAWTGTFYHKNFFGRTMALAAITFTFVAMTKVNLRLPIAIGTLVAMLLVFLSRSRSAIVGMIFAWTLVGFMRLLQRHAPGPSAIATLLLTCIAFGVITLAIYDDPRLSRPDGESVLSGRSEIWAADVRAARARPWLGFGFGVYPADSTPSDESVDRFNVDHAHNGLLDLVLGLGLAGLAAFVVPFTTCALRAFRLGASARSLLGLWPLVYFAFFIGANLTESELVRHNSIYWVLYVATAMRMDRNEAEAS